MTTAATSSLRIVFIAGTEMDRSGAVSRNWIFGPERLRLYPPPLPEAWYAVPCRGVHVTDAPVPAKAGPHERLTPGPAKSRTPRRLTPGPAESRTPRRRLVQ